MGGQPEGLSLPADADYCGGIVLDAGIYSDEEGGGAGLLE
jgi:hypothetical protein